MIDYSSVSQIKEILELFRLGMQKKFGQNFLISDRFRNAVFEQMDIESVSSAWEIGPGLGSLTALFPEDKNLVLFEIDYGFIRFLETEFPRRRIVAGDFIKTFPAFCRENPVPDLIYGNLPYCAAAAMIGARMKARPGSKDYSSFSLLCALDYNVEIPFQIPADAFFPQPEVVSAVVVMTRRSGTETVNRDLYLMLAKEMFKSRRKTLRNNLNALKGRFPLERLEAAFCSAGVELNDRGENVDPEILCRVVGFLSES